MGTVSAVIGKEYVRPKPIVNEFSGVLKPLKLDSEEFPMSEIWNEEGQLSMAAKNGAMQNDVAEFLFKMLGDGFELDRDVVHEVLGHCGYDVEKSMEKLIDLSASTLEKYDDVVGIGSPRSAESSQKMESFLHQEQSQHSDYAKSNARCDLQREVLEALFTVSERIDEKPRKRRRVKERETFGKPVVKPLRDTITKYKTAISEPKVAVRDEDEDTVDSYDFLRKAVKEYWGTMKEYYKASVVAFAEGDHAQANKLLEQGNFFRKKARKSDERSVQKLFETSWEADDVMLLDLSVHDPKEAIRLLRLHLTSLSGIPSIQHLMVLVGTDDVDTTKGARKRLIKKFLEKESIKWTDEENGQKLSIAMDVINPKHLSFANNNK